MNRRCQAWASFFLVLLSIAAAQERREAPQTAPEDVQTRLAELKDEARDRTVPVKYYLPAGAAERGPMPLVVLSHGLGGTREVGAYLAEHWAAAGYVVVALQHPGSDDAVWRGRPAAERMEALRAATRNPQNAVDRAGDVSFVLDVLQEEHQRKQGIGALIDPERIAAAGHSFGAHTVLAIAGQRFGARGGQSRADPRVKAVVSMSSQAPRNDPAVAYAQVKVPILHLTGTEDRSAIDPTVKPEDRQAAYRGISAPDQYLIVFEGADHGVFSGVGAARWRGQRDAARDGVVHDLVQRASVLFLDAMLKQDADAQEKLRGGALKEMVGEAGTVEQK